MKRKRAMIRNPGKAGKGSILKAVAAGGGTVLRQNKNQPEVLLIFRRGVWDLPKGKLEAGERIEECAIREVKEETGMEVSPEITSFLVKTYHEYEQDGTRYGKTTYWYSMALSTGLPAEFHPEIEEGIERVEWHTLTEAKKRVGYDNLIKVLESLENFIKE